MFKLFFFISLFLFSFLTFAQQKETTKLRQLLAKHKFEQACELSKDFRKKYPKNAEICYLKTLSEWYFSKTPKNKSAETYLSQAFSDFRLAWEFDTGKKFVESDTHFLSGLKTELHYKESHYFQKKQWNRVQWHTDFLAKYLHDTSSYYPNFHPEWVARKRQEESNRIQKQLLGTAEEYEYVKKYDYSKIDMYVSKAPKALKSIDETIIYLMKGAKNDPEKARAIFKWIARNISYDYTFSTFYAAETFEKRSGVCNGFADLFQTMCEKAGLQSDFITGYAKGSGYKQGSSQQSNHAWNTVMLYGHYYLIETTWASCIGSDDFYFLANPEQLIYTHLPSNDKWQFLEKPVDFKTFDELENPYPSAFESNPDKYKRSFIKVL